MKKLILAASLALIAIPSAQAAYTLGIDHDGDGGIDYLDALDIESVPDTYQIVVTDSNGDGVISQWDTFSEVLTYEWTGATLNGIVDANNDGVAGPDYGWAGAGIHSAYMDVVAGGVIGAAGPTGFNVIFTGGIINAYYDADQAFLHDTPADDVWLATLEITGGFSDLPSIGGTVTSEAEIWAKFTDVLSGTFFGVSGDDLESLIEADPLQPFLFALGDVSVEFEDADVVIAAGPEGGPGGTWTFTVRDNGGDVIFAVPEPATLSLLGLGLLGFGAASRKKRAA